MRKTILWVVLTIMLFVLSGCTALDELSRSDALPDLRLLTQPVYEEPAAETTSRETDDDVRLDLWLDASQVMGGINPNEDSMYPHSSRKYREGGFHYRYENQTGMYETVLRCMLASVEDSRVRLLRFGNERLPDDYLMDHVKRDATPEELRSIRRDMLTFAIDPMPGILETFSGEKMTDSFYSLGTPQLNRLNDLNRRQLENPDLSASMAKALDQQLHAISRGYDDSLTALGDDDDYPLLYALSNLDLTRLSVITFDPAGIRRLNRADDTGDVHALVEELLALRGVFDKGLSVGLYAFTLDYMGQITSFASADLQEPLLWGRLDYNNSTGRSDSELVMPRTLLTLVIGKGSQVEAFTADLNRRLAASDTLKVPRGPQKGQLTYTQNGETVVQEPFGFAYEYTRISRATVQPITQQTTGVSLDCDQASVSKAGSLYTVTLAPENGTQPDRTLTLSLPLTAPSGGMTLDAEMLTNIQLSVENALLQSDVLVNRPDAVIPEGAQAITLRDRIYVFSSQEAQSPVQCSSVASDGKALTIQLTVDGSALKPGYYRIQFSADLPGESFAWQTPEWVRTLNANVSNEQVSRWESFTALLSKHERKRDYISRPYQHAWGDASNTSYYGETVPECPPVMLAPGLSELVSQLQHAAHPSSMPYIRFVFDLFVPNHPQ